MLKIFSIFVIIFSFQSALAQQEVKEEYHKRLLSKMTQKRHNVNLVSDQLFECYYKNAWKYGMALGAAQNLAANECTKEARGYYGFCIKFYKKEQCFSDVVSVAQGTLIVYDSVKLGEIPPPKATQYLTHKDVYGY